jgi:hypothetical protein
MSYYWCTFSGKIFFIKKFKKRKKRAQALQEAILPDTLLQGFIFYHNKKVMPYNTACKIYTKKKQENRRKKFWGGYIEVIGAGRSVGEDKYTDKYYKPIILISETELTTDTAHPPSPIIPTACKPPPIISSKSKK